ncbi:protein-glutamate O-methyltransferase CheR [Hyphobacterium sp. HN65]|uniref:protein-glutamate O-methyltransferase n=1 Tax=Hyphobacterium lacteum TaxID=3116575 RepID=A0ABU7LR33_9PROT|nr:protein-glutamate O-methyltransferase CheR [Hyphobacterium sp. HN65]MEE2526096.1 protein-glutamate O-methyltransferase CheR [Hyphobacterium sp. HN65]
MLDNGAIKSISAEARRRAGIAIPKGQTYLVEARLAPIARSEGYESQEDLINALAQVPEDRLWRRVVESLADHETWFFRDPAPLDHFMSDILPVLARIKARKAPIRIWSAGCGTGQEAWSLAMLLEEHKDRLAGIDIEIVGTDICSRAIDRAQTGAYSQFEVQRGLSIHRLIEHFKPSGNQWVLKDSVKRWVRFERGNLLKPQENLGEFDIIFCRNVLSGMTPDARKHTLAQLATRLAPAGYLVLGPGETIAGAGDLYRSLTGARGVYARTMDRQSKQAA